MRVSRFGVVVLVGALTACSSSSSSNSGSTSCGAFSACGGNIAGTWMITGLCGPGAMGTQPVMGCTGGSGTINASATGSVTFGADMTYTVTSTTTGTLAEKLPKSCFAGVSCAMLQDQLMQQGTFSSATCADDGTNCNCNLTIAPMPNTDTGTYTVSGTTITTMPANGSPGSSSQFCVSGTQLTIATNPDPMQPMVVVVAKK